MTHTLRNQEICTLHGDIHKPSYCLTKATLFCLFLVFQSCGASKQEVLRVPQLWNTRNKQNNVAFVK